GRVITENEGLEHLVRRYLSGFGPASVSDISSWAGIPITTLKPVVDAMTLRRFRAATDSELVDLPRQPIPGPETPAPVRFLPTWDATLLAHARRTQILPEEYRSAIFNSKNPQSLTTFLVDGAVAGIWRQEGEKVVFEPFAPLPKATRRELEDEASRLAAFLSD
ncbi:MAG: DNA glycosylase AlkZ-like family protein, partial [Acidimicrobiia bacterium]